MESKCTKFEYSSGSVIYKGEHWKTNPSEDDPFFIITKFTYSGTSVVMIQISEGSWTNRSSLF